MGKGRPKIATEVHRAKGSYALNPQRENKNEPKPIREAPAKPETLMGDSVASDKWDSLCVILDQLGLIAQTDADLMELFCITFSQYRRLLKEVNENGFTETNQHGESKRSPIVIEYRNSVEVLRRLIPEFGLSPSSRSRLVSVKKEEKTDFQKWLEKRGTAKN
jgi:P27 family predicted phage terminase small subunit